jgi:DNA-binding transcriptional ArsR family regulator
MKDETREHAPFQSFTIMARALADNSRVRALMAMRHGELCLAQLIELLGLAPSTVSKHMSLLVQAGLAEVRKDGRWHFYRLARAEVQPQVQMALKWCHASLRHEQAIAADDHRIAEIRKMDLRQLCSRYKATENTSPRKSEADHGPLTIISPSAPQMLNRTG